MPTITVAGTRVEYATAGSGPAPVVFVHGGFGSTGAIWQRAMTALPAAYTAYAPHLFLSERPPGGWSVSAFADHVHAFMRALGLGRATVVGHSMGGVVCQLIALRDPESLARVVLVATGATVANHGIARELLQEISTGSLTRERMVAISRHWFHVPPSREEFDAYVDAAMRAPAEALVAVQTSLIETDLVGRLHEIRTPTLIVHGGKDHGRRLEHAKTLQQGIAGSRLVTIPESGHTPMMETPTEFNQALHAFLNDS